MAQKNGPAEDSERKMGTKQPRDDRGGERLKREVVKMDKDYEENLEMEEQFRYPRECT